MEDKKINLSLKNLILSLTSALALVVATVCWFVMSGSVGLEKLTASVDTSLSNVDFFQAVDENKNGVVDANETYKKIETANIDTKYMVPGEKYFYKVNVYNNKTGVHFGLFFNDITDSDSLGAQVKVSAKIVKSGTTLAHTDECFLSAIYETDDGGITDATILTASDLTKGDYEIYYTVKLIESTTILHEDLSLTVNDVVVSFFES